MARRYDQYYRVKPRDNLGDPEYWNRRFDDIDRRVSSNEDGLDAIGGLTAYVEGLALDRLDLVLAPALDKITLVSQQGFLLAHSSTSITLDTNTTQTFAIPDPAERELFAPSPYVTIVREANSTDYAFARLVSWDRNAGQLTLQPLHIGGNAGPFDDWVIYVGTAISQAIEDNLTQVLAAKAATYTARDAASASAASAATDRATVLTAKSDAIAARDAAAASAAAAATWDPSSYSTTAQMNAAIAAVINGAPGSLDTLKELADALGADANFSATVTASLGNRVRVDTNAQGLSTTQQQNARTNIGVNTINKNGVDLNALKVPGVYDGNNFANSPDGTASWFYVEVTLHSGFVAGSNEYVVQRASTLTQSGGGREYIRWEVANSWSAWTRVVTDTGGAKFTGGFTFQAYQNPTGSFTVDATKGNYQYVYNAGAFTITAPAVDCAVDLLIACQAGAGAVTFSGFIVSATNYGDPLGTTGYYVVSIRRIAGVPTYVIKALQ